MTRLLFALLCLAAAPAGAQSYRIVPARSQIVYAMSHPAHDWTGTSRRVSGTLEVAQGRLTGGRVSAPVTSFSSGNRSRDSNMASDTEAYLYPNVTFVATRVDATSEDHAVVRGTLTFHGVARPVTFPATVSVDARTVHVQGTFDVTLTEFDIRPPSLLGVRTRDHIALTVDLVGSTNV